MGERGTREVIDGSGREGSDGGQVIHGNGREGPGDTVHSSGRLQRFRLQHGETLVGNKSSTDRLVYCLTFV